MPDAESLYARGLISDAAMDRLRDTMTHQPEQPNPAQPYLDAATRFGTGLRDTLMVGPRLMGDVMEGRLDPNSPDAIRRSADVALNTAGMGMMGAERGAVGIFGGQLAKTADLDALARAQKMAEAGHYPSDIWEQTGWFRGADRKWRFEIPDDKSTFTREPAFGRNSFDTMKDVLNHPALYKNYPELADVWAQRLRSDASPRGEYYPPGSMFPRDVIGLRKGLDDPRSTALHELQHAVQNREGFDPGTNISAAGGYDPYRRTIGEVEARNVEARRNMPSQRLKDVPPVYTQDTPNIDQIFAPKDKLRSSSPRRIPNDLRRLYQPPRRQET